jgi:hypothetical protein
MVDAGGVLRARTPSRDPVGSAGSRRADGPGRRRACGTLRRSGACLHPDPSIASLVLVAVRRRQRHREEVSLIAASRPAPGMPPPDGVVSRDGTALRSWSNNADGVPLVISNGLGAPPSAWPRLAETDCGFAAVSWWHRGLGGSERPDDPTRIHIEDHAPLGLPGVRHRGADTRRSRPLRRGGP